MKLKKYLFWVLIVVCALALAACGGEEVTEPPKEPPGLRVTAGTESIAAMRGTYSWTYYVGSSGIGGSDYTSDHPLEEGTRELMPTLETAEPAARLEFSELAGVPAEITACCWDTSCWGNPSAESESVLLDGTSMKLKEGAYIYEIYAKWEGHEDYHGEAFYSIYITYAK